ncbi:hypothetical protein FIV34_03290 [Luteibacter pinisoli]|uniref:Uncharacterized protein n=1 Tax=Luteibacter pinisoli TaxID=2589080 RepID=A0A4Y5YZR2_9GAMM|nr:hypothetical protein [Luteibacter pinisoli]QDE38294.1 hypothetical protein FIV34_03290 [Luteibacter pinisoli]
MSLSVLVALVFLLPGLAFVFSLQRGVIFAKQSPPDSPVSETLASAIAASIALNAAGYSLCVFLCDAWGLPSPDAVAFISMMSGDSKGLLASEALASVARYPVRICAYFCALTMVGSASGFAGRTLRARLRANDGGALWGTLLSPRGVNLVRVTLEVEMDGVAFLFAGALRDYAVDRDGSLDRVVLEGVSRRPLANRAPGDRRGRNRRPRAPHSNGWTPVPGNYVILNVGATKSVRVDYLAEKARSGRRSPG